MASLAATLGLEAKPRQAGRGKAPAVVVAAGAQRVVFVVDEFLAEQALFQQSLALSTPDAYNPFNGSCLNGQGGPDCTPSSQAARRKRLARSADAPT